MSNPNLEAAEKKEAPRANKQANARALIRGQNQADVSTEVEDFVASHAPPMQQLEVLKAILKELIDIKGRL